MASHDIGHTETDAATAVVGLGARHDVTSVISLLETLDNRRLMEALANNTAVRSNLAIIATSTWADRDMVVEGFEDAARGIITLG